MCGGRRACSRQTIGDAFVLFSFVQASVQQGGASAPLDTLLQGLPSYSLGLSNAHQQQQQQQQVRICVTSCQTCGACLLKESSDRTPSACN